MGRLQVLTVTGLLLDIGRPLESCLPVIIGHLQENLHLDSIGLPEESHQDHCHHHRILVPMAEVRLSLWGRDRVVMVIRVAMAHVVPRAMVHHLPADTVRRRGTVTEPSRGMDRRQLRAGMGHLQGMELMTTGTTEAHRRLMGAPMGLRLQVTDLRPPTIQVLIIAIGASVVTPTRGVVEEEVGASNGTMHEEKIWS